MEDEEYFDYCQVGSINLDQSLHNADNDCMQDSTTNLHGTDLV